MSAPVPEFPWVLEVGSEGNGQRVPLPTSHVQRESGYVWIHLDINDKPSQEWLEKHSGLDPVARAALTEAETRPRVATIGNTLLLILRGVNLNPGQDVDDMVSIRVLVEPGRIISARRRSLLAARDLYAMCESGRPPRTCGAWVASLVERLLDRMSEPIEQLEERFDELELRAIDVPARVLRRDLGEARRAAISLRRYLAPQRDALQRLSTDHGGVLDDHERLRLRESADRILRFLEDLEAGRDRASVTQEELAGRLAEAMNRTSYLLTLVAGVFLPLGFLTGLLGINVGGLPGTESKYAFGIVCGVCVALATGQIWYFRRKKLL